MLKKLNTSPFLVPAQWSPRCPQYSASPDRALATWKATQVWDHFGAKCPRALPAPQTHPSAAPNPLPGPRTWLSITVPADLPPCFVTSFVTSFAFSPPAQSHAAGTFLATSLCSIPAGTGHGDGDGCYSTPLGPRNTVRAQGCGKESPACIQLPPKKP